MIAEVQLNWSLIIGYQRRIKGGGYRGSAPLAQWKLWFLVLFFAPTCAEPPLDRKKMLSTPGEISKYTPVSYVCFWTLFEWLIKKTNAKRFRTNETQILLFWLLGTMTYIFKFVVFLKGSDRQCIEVELRL